MKNDINKELIVQVKKVIEEEMENRNSVMTFKELEHVLDMKKIDYRLPYDNNQICFIALTPVLMAWCGWKNEVMFAIKELSIEEKISLDEVTPLLYFYDGLPDDLTTIPMATKGAGFPYPSPHWIPLGINKKKK